MFIICAGPLSVKHISCVNSYCTMHFYKLCALALDLEQGQGVMIDLETRLMQ